jgi:hypothetical protein
LSRTEQKNRAECDTTERNRAEQTIQEAEENKSANDVLNAACCVCLCSLPNAEEPRVVPTLVSLDVSDEEVASARPAVLSRGSSGPGSPATPPHNNSPSVAKKVWNVTRHDTTRHYTTFATLHYTTLHYSTLPPSACWICPCRFLHSSRPLND